MRSIDVVLDLNYGNLMKFYRGGGVNDSYTDYER